MTQDSLSRSATLRLTGEEQAMLAGEAGPAVRKAIEIIVALGQIYGASDLVPVAGAQVSGVSYKNLGDAGLQFLNEWAAQGARVQVPATLNPAGMDLARWRELGFSAGFARKQDQVVRAYASLGIKPTCTCAPYQIGHAPRFGQHLAWSESSAVSHANSVLGARTNREGGPSSLAAGIAGRTARYGLHLDENRLASAVVDVRQTIASEADLGALGYMVGQWVGNGVPYFRFRGQDLAAWDLKTLGAAMGASGAVGLYHIEGVTAEARVANMLNESVRTLIVEDLRSGYDALNGDAERIDLVSLGCPHASIQELEAIAGFLLGRQVKADLWITTARATRLAAEESGLVARIQDAGGRVVADTCTVVAPVADLGYRALATNSAKMAFYAPAHSGLAVRFGTLEQCLDAAVAGFWGVAPARPGPARRR